MAVRLHHPEVFPRQIFDHHDLSRGPLNLPLLRLGLPTRSRSVSHDQRVGRLRVMALGRGASGLWLDLQRHDLFLLPQLPTLDLPVRRCSLKIHGTS